EVTCYSNCREEFVARYRSRPEFRYHNSRRVIGKNRGLLKKSAARKRERQRSDDRITRAGDIKNFSRHCWNMRDRIVGEQRHALFPASDQNGSAIKRP